MYQPLLQDFLRNSIGLLFVARLAQQDIILGAIRSSLAMGVNMTSHGTEILGGITTGPACMSSVLKFDVLLLRDLGVERLKEFLIRFGYSRKARRLWSPFALHHDFPVG